MSGEEAVELTVVARGPGSGWGSCAGTWSSA